MDAFIRSSGDKQQRLNSSTASNKPVKNASDKDDDETDGKKPAPSFLDKLDAAVQWLLDTISNTAYNIGKRITFIQNTGKNFEAEIKKLEKKYEARVGLKLNMYKFDMNVLETFLQCTKNQYTQHKERTDKFMSDYEKVIHNNMTEDDFIQKNEDLKDFSEYKKKYIDLITKQVNIQTTSIDSQKEILKLVRAKFKSENADTVVINEKIYGDCRRDIQSYNDKMIQINNDIKKWKTESQTLKRKLQTYSRDATSNGRASDSFSTCFRNCIKYFEDPIDGYLFYVTNYNEYIVNCRLVVKKCLGG